MSYPGKPIMDPLTLNHPGDDPAIFATSAETPQVLLEHYLKSLRLPTFGREYDAGNTTRSRSNAPRKALTIRASCCACVNWKSSNANKRR